MKYVYLLRVTFEATDDVAAKEAVAGKHTLDRARRALFEATVNGTTRTQVDTVSEKLQRVKDGDQPRLVRRYR